MDCSLPGSSVHGIFQARVREWGAIAFSIDVLVISINYQGKLVFEVATKILTIVELLPWSRICSYKRNLYPISNFWVALQVTLMTVHIEYGHFIDP